MTNDQHELRVNPFHIQGNIRDDDPLIYRIGGRQNPETQITLLSLRAGQFLIFPLILSISF